MMVFLSKTEGAFTVAGRGCVVIPVALPESGPSVKVGDAIQLRGSSGTLVARVTAVEWLVREDHGCRLAFVLSKEIDKSQVPGDAEIWVEDSK
jgi:hypothetical protein